MQIYPIVNVKNFHVPESSKTEIIKEEGMGPNVQKYDNSLVEQ